jgi:MscS family membrane protein
MLLSFTWIVLRFADSIGLILMQKASKTESKQDDQIISFVIDISKIFIAIFALFFILGAIFNLNVASLVAGLGIGGLAIALAAKESLENLFGSFTIFFDKPFVVGDLVKVGNLEGVVEKVGFRSTRIRTLEKTYVTIPNKKMVDAELDNLSLRTFRRVKFTFSLIYNTPPDKLNAIIEDVQKLIDTHPNTNDEGRARLFELAKSGIDIRVIYFITTADWNLYVDLRQEINFKIMEIVKKHGSEFAYPTSTVFNK